MDKDIRSIVLRKDLAAFQDKTGKAACAFYTRIRGVGGERPLSLVRYELDQSEDKPKLLRREYAFTYATGSTLLSPSFGDTTALPDLDEAKPMIDTMPEGPKTRPLVEGVIGFGMKFVDSNGAIKEAYTAETNCVILTLLVLDSPAFHSATSEQIDHLTADFNEPGMAQTHKDHWQSIMDGGSWGTGQPESIRRGLKIFERRIPISVNAVRS